MDETPEELEQIRREAAQIDPYRYRRRTRAMAAIGIGALSAGLVWAVLVAWDRARNPCERVANYYCHQDPKSLSCQTYDSLRKDSVEDRNPQMRGTLRLQCVTHITRMKEDNGIVIK